jgi:hypothetical protein
MYVIKGEIIEGHGYWEQVVNTWSEAMDVCSKIKGSRAFVWASNQEIEVSDGTQV